MSKLFSSLFCCLVLSLTVATVGQPYLLEQPHREVSEPESTSQTLASPDDDQSNSFATKEELLDLRAAVLEQSAVRIDWLFKGLAIWLTFLGIIVPLFGVLAGRYFYNRFREEAAMAARSAKDAQSAAEGSSQKAKDALREVEGLRTSALQAQQEAQSAGQAAEKNKAALDKLRATANERFRRIREVAEMDDI